VVRQRIEEIREEIAALASQLEDEQERLSRANIKYVTAMTPPQRSEGSDLLS
jgi:hypothetical protein